MSKKSMNAWIKELEYSGEIIHVKTKVSTDLEIAEISDRMMQAEKGGKAILFENNGTEFPLLINAFGSENRIKSIFGGKNPETIFPELFSLLDELQAAKSIKQKLTLFLKNKNLLSIFPKLKQKKGDCQAFIYKNPKLSMLPILKSWPFDAAPFITLPIVFTKHPETGIRNIGMYRLQVINEITTGMHWHRHKGGAAHYKAWKKHNNSKMPVAVILGGDPLYTYMATAPLPENIDELLVCGLIRNKKVDLVKCITQDIEVPADADIVIEGYIDTNEALITEGPFGDHTGFYSLEDQYPAFHITAITHRKDAVYPATIVGIPPKEDYYLGLTTERLFKPAIKLAIAPELIDFHLPAVGVAHNLVLLKVKNSWPGAVNKTIHALLGAGQMMFSKFLIALPENLELTDHNQVINHIATHITPESFTISSGPADELEHASPELVFGGKCVIDLSITKENTKAIASKNKNEICFGKIRIIANSSLPELNVSTENEFCIIVDYPELLNNIPSLIWWIFANTDPKRDIHRSGSRIVWDARHISIDKQNQRPWPNPVVSSDPIIELVDKRWQEYGLGDFISSPSLKYKSFVKNSGASVKFN
jgi:4-hydroxy-3-polyprenylbenzoate decarboxylase